MTIKPALVTPPLIIYQGATFQQQFALANPDQTPVDLTGFRAHMQARVAPNADIFLDLSTENGGIILGGTAGTLTLTMQADDTALLDEFLGVWDLKLIFDGESPVVVTRLMQGHLSVSPQITE